MAAVRQSPVGTLLIAVFSAFIILSLPQVFARLFDKEPVYQRFEFHRGTSASADNTYPLAITDSTGYTTLLPKKPSKIISLAPSLTEILCEIGVSNQILAITSFCIKSNPEYRDVLEDKTIILNGINPAAEQIAELGPDLILTVSNSSQEFVSSMRKLGFPVIVFGNDSLDHVLEFITDLGTITEHSHQAHRVKSLLLERLQRVDQRVQNIPPQKRPRCLIMFDLAGGGAGARGSFMGDILERAGGSNLASSLETRWPTLSAEWIMAQNPDYIFLDDYREGDELDHAVLFAREQIAGDPVFGKLTALKEDRLHIIGENILVIPGPRTVKAVERLHFILYPSSTRSGEMP